ncbi:MAG: right-handed parallel beta-helix repeat-containing protein [Bacteroidetes bacterium]|nr:right-handed parallel beta-helix repeat-containing protein [Bacteroidota bacterium]
MTYLAIFLTTLAQLQGADISEPVEVHGNTYYWNATSNVYNDEIFHIATKIEKVPFHPVEFTLINTIQCNDFLLREYEIRLEKYPIRGTVQVKMSDQDRRWMDSGHGFFKSTGDPLEGGLIEYTKKRITVLVKDQTATKLEVAYSVAAPGRWEMQENKRILSLEDFDVVGDGISNDREEVQRAIDIASALNIPLQGSGKYLIQPEPYQNPRGLIIFRNLDLQGHFKFEPYQGYIPKNYDPNARWRIHHFNAVVIESTGYPAANIKLSGKLESPVASFVDQNHFLQTYYSAITINNSSKMDKDCLPPNRGITINCEIWGFMTGTKSGKGRWNENIKFSGYLHDIGSVVFQQPRKDRVEKVQEQILEISSRSFKLPEGYLRAYLECFDAYDSLVFQLTTSYGRNQSIHGRIQPEGDELTIELINRPHQGYLKLRTVYQTEEPGSFICSAFNGFAPSRQVNVSVKTENIGTSGYDHDVYISGTTENCVVENSHFIGGNGYRSAGGVHIRGGSNRNITIQNNTFDNVRGYAIDVVGKNVVIQGNKLSYNAQLFGHVAAAIGLGDSPGAVVRNNRIMGNMVIREAVHVFDNPDTVYIQDNTFEGLLKYGLRVRSEVFIEGFDTNHIEAREAPIKYYSKGPKTK